MTDRLLPPRFADLQPWVAAWALPNERERYFKLHSVDIDELRAFYDAMMPRMDGVLDYLNGFDARSMPEDVTCLFQLAMTFAETAHPIDLGWKSVDFDAAYPWQKLEFRTVGIGS